MDDDIKNDDLPTQIETGSTQNDANVIVLPDNPPAKKQRRKPELSDAERDKRRERMLALRKKLGQNNEEKTPKVAEGKQKKEEQIEDAESTAPKKSKKVQKTVKSDSETDEEGAPPPERTPKPAERSKPRKHGGVKKKISIKYYGEVSDLEMMTDSRMLQGIHNEDYTANERMLSASSKANKSYDRYEELRKQIFGS